MYALGSYLLQSCVCLIALYIPYVLILRHTTFFTLNRCYLIGGLLLSFILPAIKITKPIYVYTIPDYQFIEEIEPMLTGSVQAVRNDGLSSSPIHYGLFLAALYAAGVLFNLLRSLLSIVRILKIKRQGNPLIQDGISVYIVDAIPPFTFFQWIFLPETNVDCKILEHEATHVRQFHWLDLMIMEVASIVLWFNPIMIFYCRSLKQQHEYLADQSVIRNSVGIEGYLRFIGQQLETKMATHLISPFHFQSIKKRIHMITKTRTSVYWLGTYLVTIPIVLCLLVAFSPRPHFNLTVPISSDANQPDLSLGLPIDEKEKVTLESGFGERMHPVLGVKKMHLGVDLTAEGGVPVISSEEGIVIEAQFSGPRGNFIVVQHDETYSTTYSHLKSMEVKKGEKVIKGQAIGQVGNTGLSSKHHLHFEVLKNGEAVDPIQHVPEINRFAKKAQ